MSAEHLGADYHQIRQRGGYFAGIDVALVRLFGEDVLEWLQGQATNDLRDWPVGPRRQFCFCLPTGQMLARIDAWRSVDSVFLAFDSLCLADVKTRIDDMVIMEDVSYEILSDSHRLLTFQGPNAERPPEGCSHAFPSDRTGLGGVDYWIQGPLPEIDCSSLDLLEVLRLEAGLARHGHDWGAKTLPPELGEAFVKSHVSYTKGCYTGQEVLMRVHSRGHTNKTWVGVRSKSEMARGAKLLSTSGEPVGVITSATASPSLGQIGAGMVRNESSTAGTILIIEGGGEVVVTTMPLHPTE